MNITLIFKTYYEVLFASNEVTWNKVIKMRFDFLIESNNLFQSGGIIPHLKYIIRIYYNEGNLPTKS